MSDYFIRFPDPSIAMGGQIATTGETREEYSYRLMNIINSNTKENYNKNKEKKMPDSKFVTRLPYTMQVELKNVDDQVFNNPYETFMENLKASFGDAAENQAIISEISSQTDEIQKQLHVSELCTTELGGNDAINCYWAFNENDDIIYPVNALDPQTCKLGLGRVYADMYQRRQVILWLTFGVPRYCGIYDYYSKAYQPELASEMHSGTLSTSFHIGRIVAGVLSFTWTLMTLPYWVLSMIGKAFTKYTITKYCELNATMPLYFKAVNNLMATVAVNMGIQKNEYVDDKDANTTKIDPNNLPEMMKNGLDVYRIVAKRAIYSARREGRISDDTKLTTEQMFELYNKSMQNMLSNKITIPEGMPPEYSGGIGHGFLENVWESFLANATASTAYIGFRVEKSVDASESISNSTGESELKGILNAGVETREKISFASGGGNLSQSGILGLVGDTVTAMKDMMAGAVSGFEVSGLAGLLTGTGHYDIPDVWKDSSFNSNYSFRTQLVSHYADRISIFQNCYVPLFFILGAALPRQVGRNTYVQPFMCRGYCQGRFAVSYGIIDSVSITRGGDEFGWTEEGFPTKIDVSWTIKDLSPLIFLGIGTGIVDSFVDIFTSNTNMMEYLSTLGGLGLKERVLFFPRIMKKFKAWWNMNFETKLKNPFYWGSTLGHVPGLQTLLAWKYSNMSNR